MTMPNPRSMKKPTIPTMRPTTPELLQSGVRLSQYW